MSRVLSVDVGLVIPGMFDHHGRAVPGGPGTTTPTDYFFGHSVPVKIKVERKEDCRLFWAEKTNIPIIDQQSADYFIDMYKLHPTANTYKPWNDASGSAAVTVTDIPSMVGGVGKVAAAARWLEIIVIVQSDENARYAHFRQDLTYDPAQDFGEVPITARSVGAGPRHYNYQVLRNNMAVADAGAFLGEVFAGTPAALH